VRINEKHKFDLPGVRTVTSQGFRKNRFWLDISWLFLSKMIGEGSGCDLSKCFSFFVGDRPIINCSDSQQPHFGVLVCWAYPGIVDLHLRIESVLADAQATLRRAHTSAGRTVDGRGCGGSVWCSPGAVQVARARQHGSGRTRPMLQPMAQPGMYSVAASVLEAVHKATE
jgi:hypothetical protein